MPAITFTTVRLLREFNDIDSKLYQVFISLVERFWPDSRQAARITCIFRSSAEEAAAGGKSGIHALSTPYRAIDIGAKEFTQAEIDAAAAAVNTQWVYDPARPEKQVCFAEPHGTGPHFHLQVHPSTRKR
jgi:hypothetical protein